MFWPLVIPHPPKKSFSVTYKNKNFVIMNVPRVVGSAGIFVHSKLANLDNLFT